MIESARRLRSGWLERRPGARRRRRLAGSIRKAGQPLLHQQCWCWGQDIGGSAGNLLLRYGFERIRPPAGGPPMATMYRLDRDDTITALWGFGVFHAMPDLGGMFIARYAFRPRLGPAELARNIWSPGALTMVRNVTDSDSWRRARLLLAGFCDWVAEYEEWVQAAVGPAWRVETLGRWDHPVVAAARMPDAWRRFGELVRRS